MSNDIKNVISQNLKQARLDAGLSRAEVSEKLNIDDRTIGHYETGIRQPKLELLSEMSKLYNKPIGYFFGEKFDTKDNNLNDVFIDKIIYDLIEEDAIKDDINFDELDDEHKDLLLSALKIHINKLKIKKRP